MDSNTIDFWDENKISSTLLLNNKRPEFNIICCCWYEKGDSGTSLITEAKGTVVP